MRLIEYHNTRTGDALHGAPSTPASLQALTISAKRSRQPPVLQTGDVLQLAADPAQQWFVTDLDRTGLGLRRALQHVEAHVQRITGLASVTRLTAQANAFGRPQDAALTPVVTDTPAALMESREIILDASSIGPECLVLRYAFLIRSVAVPRPTDRLNYSPAPGTTQALRIIGTIAIAAELWQVHATSV
jgi:hypothetical protein